ncbi:unnamed protein product [Bursaphelenchus okinawaensis]|uniref:C2H2-type domain-containing protein n=1 Tax=Bursaphelenchus okinawaensis TaxID=465554 RepID=A0A811KJ82_9BILA|nr:unnamed protein product [Bursaphelenchus okinawaensis]CAG9103932.1 unnamed protein product [Bursaphelenchus okinawaensis]
MEELVRWPEEEVKRRENYFRHGMAAYDIKNPYTWSFPAKGAALAFGIGVIAIHGTNLFKNKPWYYAIYPRSGLLAVGVALGYLAGYGRQKFNQNRDAYVDHYVKLHPEDFERLDDAYGRPYAKVLLPWYPKRVMYTNGKYAQFGTSFVDISEPYSSTSTVDDDKDIVLGISISEVDRNSPDNKKVNEASAKKRKRKVVEGPKRKRGRPKKYQDGRPRCVVRPIRREVGMDTVHPRACGWGDCEHVAQSIRELKQHVDQVHLPRLVSFRCEWSNCLRRESFKALYMLSLHLRRHTGERPHVCTFPFCSKSYSRLENLRTHLRQHNGEKPYPCMVAGCEKSFSNASDRTKHQKRTHSAEKHYVCAVVGCDKKYTDPSSLRKHVIKTHGEAMHNLLKLNKARLQTTEHETE